MSKGATTLILDIDSGSVGACVLTEGGERPALSLVKRVPVGTGEVRDVQALIPQLKEALTTLMPDYAKVNPKNVLVVAASPWFAGSLRTLASKSEKPVRVTQSTVARAVQQSHQAGMGHPLESIPITVLVNGYRTHAVKPVLGKSLAVTLYESVADQVFIQTVTDAAHTVAPHATLTFHTTPLVYAETVMSLSGSEYMTVLDVGCELTDVMVLSRGTLGFVGSVPQGSRSIARAVAGSGSVADSASRLIMMARGELADKDMQATAAALREAGKAWQQGFNEIMRGAGDVLPVPHQVVLVGERDELQWFTRVIDGAQNPTGSSGSTHTATLVVPEFFNGALAFGEGGSYDGSLALAALFFHMHHSGQQKVGEYKRVLYSVG